MLKINIVCVGKVKEKFFREAIEEYRKRLSKYCYLNLIEVEDSKIPEKVNDNVIKSIQEEEGKRIFHYIQKDSYCVCLDLKGKEYSSIEFSQKISKLTVEGNSRVTFIIGGTLGISEKILKISKEKICFSKMTFPHPLIRVFLLEQLFRGFKIANGETYHR